MDILKMIVNSFTNGLIDDVNKIFRRKKEEMSILKMNSLKAVYLTIFTICFLLANFTAMMAIIFRFLLGNGIIFPISSCIFLYAICISCLKGICISNKERDFFVKKIEYDKNKEDKEK